MLFDSRPSQVEAIHWTGDNFDEITIFGGEKVFLIGGARLHLKAGVDGSQDWVFVPKGHWLVHKPKDKSDIWPVENTYFCAKYRPA